jgi:hypothetical protein
MNYTQSRQFIEGVVTCWRSIIRHYSFINLWVCFNCPWVIVIM